jgi:hypothetical protein
VYLAGLALSLFALITLLMSFDTATLAHHFLPGLPRRGIGIFTIVSGAVLLLIWLALSILPAILRGEAPAEVWSYTTVVTFVIDMAILAPVLIVAGVLLLQCQSLGYLLTSVLLVFTVVLGINLTAVVLPK